MTAPVSSAIDAAAGNEIVQRARAWIGTPYQPQTSRRGSGDRLPRIVEWVSGAK